MLHGLDFQILGGFQACGESAVGKTIALQLFTGHFQFSHYSINMAPINYLLIKTNIINVLSVAIYYAQRGSFSKCLVAHFIEIKMRKKIK